MASDQVFVGLLQPGSIVGDNYRVEAFLGKGGMGEVWAARHLRLPNKRVAIKILRTQGDTLSEEALKRFRKEAEIASHLQHPHIVNIEDYNFTPSGCPFIAMEYLEGESLGTRLRRAGPFSLAETRTIIRQICRALEATHNQGILHRDLKPDNIFLTNQNQGVDLWVKVLDFGISKILGSDSQFTQITQNSVVIGSPRYVSPEQAKGHNNKLTAQADIFSLGAVAYEMLTGQPAFEGDEVSSVLYRVVHENPRPLGELLPGLPAGARHAIEKALAKKPDNRHLSAMAFSEAFDKDTLVPDDFVPPKRPPKVGETGETGKTRSSRSSPPQKRTLWLLLLVGLLALLGGALFYFWPYNTITEIPLKPETVWVDAPKPPGTPARPGPPGDTAGAKDTTRVADAGTPGTPGDAGVKDGTTRVADAGTPGGAGTKDGTTRVADAGTPGTPGDAGAKAGTTRVADARPPGGKTKKEPRGKKGNGTKIAAKEPGGPEKAGEEGVVGDTPAPKPPERSEPPRPSLLDSLTADEKRTLVGAEQALQAKRYKDAEELVRNRALTSFRKDSAGYARAYIIIVEVACAQKDLGKYNTAYASVPAQWKASAKESCRRRGFEP